MTDVYSSVKMHTALNLLSEKESEPDVVKSDIFFLEKIKA